MPVELTDEEFRFLSRYLKDPDRDSVTQRCDHVVEKVQDLHVYRTIRSLNWLLPQVDRLAVYKQIRSTFTDNYPPHVVELGCCFGTDVRQLLLDGLPSENILVVDLFPGYWDLGFDLFQDRARLRCQSAFCDASKPASELAPFREKYDVAYALLVLHVFDQVGSVGFLTSTFNLLAPGGTFFGTTVGWAAADGPWDIGQNPRWIYCKQGLIDVLTSVGFDDVSVEQGPISDRIRLSSNSSLSASVPDEGLRCWSFVARKSLPDYASC